MKTLTITTHKNDNINYFYFFYPKQKKKVDVIRLWLIQRVIVKCVTFIIFLPL